MKRIDKKELNKLLESKGLELVSESNINEADESYEEFRTKAAKISSEINQNYVEPFKEELSKAIAKLDSLGEELDSLKTPSYKTYDITNSLTSSEKNLGDKLNEVREINKYLGYLEDGNDPDEVAVAKLMLGKLLG